MRLKKASVFTSRAYSRSLGEHRSELDKIVSFFNGKNGVYCSVKKIMPGCSAGFCFIKRFYGMRSGDRRHDNNEERYSRKAVPLTPSDPDPYKILVW